ncbi:MAG: hypothetical protein KR126chlam3_01565 [Chlamydiae bacterium]|nr:hypothetical protein [Chlamydiota bacterium]
MKKHLLKILSILIPIAKASLSASISTPYGAEIEAVIFDCDGVLVDTEQMKFLAWQEALASENISFSLEEYMPFVGHNSKNILLMLKELKGTDIPDEVIELKNTRYRILRKAGIPSIQEMIAFAEELVEEKERLGIKVGIASSALLLGMVQQLAK